MSHSLPPPKRIALSSFRRPRLLFSCHRHETGSLNIPSPSFKAALISPFHEHSNQILAQIKAIFAIACFDMLSYDKRLIHQECWGVLRNLELFNGADGAARVRRLVLKHLKSTVLQKIRQEYCLVDGKKEQLVKGLRDLRRGIGVESALVHYIGHAVPPPIRTERDCYLFLRARGESEKGGVSLSSLLSALKPPATFVFDVSCAGRAVEAVRHMAPGSAFGAASEPLWKGFVAFGACTAGEKLPSSPEIPPDLFTCCIATPLRALVYHVVRETSLIDIDPASAISQIPGVIGQRSTPLGELAWILQSVTDAIAWDVLPKPLFTQLCRNEPNFAKLVTGFFVAQYVLGHLELHPCSFPRLPDVSAHPMWHVFTHNVLYAFTKLNDTHLPSFTLGRGAGATHKHHFPFFPNQLRAFQDWLSLPAPSKPPPLQLPSLLQIILAPIGRLKAARLLAQYIDLGTRSIDEMITLSFHQAIISLFPSSDRELQHIVVYFWAKFLAAFPSVTDEFYRTAHSLFQKNRRTDETMKFNPILKIQEIIANLNTPPDERALALFIMSCFASGHASRQVFKVRGELGALPENCVVLLSSDFPLIRTWALILLAKLVLISQPARSRVFSVSIHKHLQVTLRDPTPEVRAATVFFLSSLLFPPGAPPSLAGGLCSINDEEDSADFLGEKSNLLEILGEVLGLGLDPSPLVRYEVLFLISQIVLRNLDLTIAAVMQACALVNNFPTRASSRSHADAPRSESVSEGPPTPTRELIIQIPSTPPRSVPFPPTHAHSSSDLTDAPSFSPSFTRELSSPRAPPVGPNTPNVCLSPEINPSLQESASRVFDQIKGIMQHIPPPPSHKDQLQGIIQLSWSLVQNLCCDPITTIALRAAEIHRGVEALSWLYLAKQFPFSPLFSKKRATPEPQRGRSPVTHLIESTEFTETTTNSESVSLMLNLDASSGPASVLPDTVQFFNTPSPASSPPPPTCQASESACQSPLSFLGGKIPHEASRLLRTNLQKAKKASAPAVTGVLQREGSNKAPCVFSQTTLPLLPSTVGALIIAAYPGLEVGRFGEFQALVRDEFVDPSISSPPTHPLQASTLAHGSTPLRSVSTPSPSSPKASSLSKFTNSVYHSILICSLAERPDIDQLALLAVSLYEERIEHLKSRLGRSLSSNTSAIFPLMTSVINTPFLTPTVVNLSAAQASISHEYTTLRAPGPTPACTAGSLPRHSDKKHADVRTMSYQGLGIQLGAGIVGSDQIPSKPCSPASRLPQNFTRSAQAGRCQCGRESFATIVTRNQNMLISSFDVDPMDAASSPSVSPPQHPDSAALRQSGTHAQNDFTRISALARKMLTSVPKSSAVGPDAKTTPPQQQPTKKNTFSRIFSPKRPLESALFSLQPHELRKISEIRRLSLCIPPPFPPLDYLSMCKPRRSKMNGTPSSSFDRLYVKLVSEKFTEELDYHANRVYKPHMRTPCSVLVRSLYHSCNVINDDCVMPYSLESLSTAREQEFATASPLVCLRAGSKRGNREFIKHNYQDAVDKEKCRLKLLVRPPSPESYLRAPRTPRTPRVSGRPLSKKRSYSWRLGSSSPATSKKSRRARRPPLSPHTATASRMRKTSPAPPSPLHARRRRGGLHKRTDSDTNLISAKKNSQLAEELKRSIPLLPERGGVDLSDGIAIPMKFLPEQLSFLHAQTTIRQGAAEAAAYFGAPRASRLSDMFRSSPSSGSDARAPRSVKIKPEPAMARAGVGPVRAMAFHSFRPLFVSVDARSTLYVTNLKTRARVSKYMPSRLRDTDLQAWPRLVSYAGSNYIGKHSPRNAPFCSLCGISSYARACGMSDETLGKCNDAALDFAVRHRPEFGVSSLRLLNEHSPHSLLAAGCDDGAIRFYSNYETPQLCRLVSAFSVQSCAQRGLSGATPYNYVHGFWEMWNLAHRDAHSGVVSDSLPPMFLPLVSPAVRRLKALGHLTDSAFENLRAIDRTRSSEMFLTSVSGFTRQVARNRLLYRPARRTPRPVAGAHRLGFELGSPDAATLFAFYTQPKVFAYDLVHERLADTFATRQVTPTALSVDPQNASFLAVGGARGELVILDKREAFGRPSVLHRAAGEILSVDILPGGARRISLATAGSFKLFDLRMPRVQGARVHGIKEVQSFGNVSDLLEMGRPQDCAALLPIREHAHTGISAMDTHPLSGLAAVASTRGPGVRVFDHAGEQVGSVSVAPPPNVWKSKPSLHASNVAWHPLHGLFAVAMAPRGAPDARAAVQVFGLSCDT